MEEIEHNQMNSLVEVSNFLNRYKDFSKRLERQKVIHYKTKFNGLFSGYHSLKNIITIFNEKEAIDYNIFNILNIKTAEVKTHTPFLKNLLDANGTHGQTDLFLSSFIQNFIPENKRDFFVLQDKNNYHIQEEKPIPNGRIDIYLQSINSKKKFGIIIENKLFAGDQDLQLKRYYDFLEGKKYKDQQMIIFYLTINGGDPSKDSISEEPMMELKNKEILCNLSYKTNIKNWLQEIITEIKADKVKFLIEQYVEIINHL